ncbi:hypothetical protein [Capnocytophaga sputigena]|jgi:hypothetical protein|uniref:hypothetical protein n=1 Tax=Capnocytophaga sputigena TaxID=1019 RepID=UPI00248D5E13|nr:hypothetical protein [Capnocytophaga sputigena]
MSIDNLIDSLKKLDLSTYPEKEIRYLLQQIGKIPAIELTFHKGKEIMRARPNENENIRYRRKSDFSYKPQEKNDKYQRASTPYRTMFYASCLSENLNDKNISMRITPTLESIHKELYDNNSSFYKKISYGRWTVIEDLKLFPIIHNSNFCNKTSYLKGMKDYYNNTNIEFNCPQDLIEKSNKILSYLADEFAKEEIREHYDYMISAIFSELVTENCFDGIFYPSIRTGGKGFNIAITPKATEKLRLIVAGECSVYKHKMETRVGNNAIVRLNGNEEEFDMIDLENSSIIESKFVDELGFDSIEDFRDYCNRNKR